MRILHVVPSYWPAVRYGGPIYSVHGLCRGLHSIGHDVHVLTTNVDGDRDTDVAIARPVEMDGVKVWYFPSRIGRRVYYSPQMKRTLYDKIRGFDIVHTHSVFLWPTWAAAHAARAAGIPYVVSPRGMMQKDLVRRKSRWKKSLWISFIERANLQNAAGIHATARLEEAGLREFGLSLPPVFVIPNGVDPPCDAQADTASEDVIRVARSGGYMLYLGRINWKKRLDRVMELWRDSMGCRLVIAGNDEDGYLRTLREQITRHHIENVTFIPRFVSGYDKTYLFQHASGFVLPSYSENFGNAAVEAMSLGVPVVVTEEVGSREVVEESGGGLVVPVEQLGWAIRELLHDPERRKHMGAKGRDFVARKLSWEHVARQMGAAYHDMITPGRSQ